MTKPPARKHFTRQRRKLSLRTRQQLATQASNHLHKLRHQLPKHAKVGIYYDGFGELPTQPILDWCKRLGYQAYLPIVGTLGHQQKNKPNNPLRFAPIYHSKLSNLPTYTHTLGMQQPRSRKLLEANQLDVIFCPLVAMDKLGTRMGMGGGYYDRTLAKCHQFKLKKPLKIAWCYDFQLVDYLPKQSWDVPMDIVITPTLFYQVAQAPKLYNPTKNYHHTGISTGTGTGTGTIPSINADTKTNHNLSSAEAVSRHLQQAENSSLNSNHNSNHNNSLQNHNNSTLDATFSDNELATLINPQRFTQLMSQADYFLEGVGSLVEDYEIDIDESIEDKNSDI